MQMTEVAVDSILGSKPKSVIEDLDTLQLVPKEDLIKRFEASGRAFDKAVIDTIYRVRACTRFSGCDKL